MMDYEKICREFFTDNDGNFREDDDIPVISLMESMPSLLQRVATQARAEQREVDAHRLEQGIVPPSANDFGHDDAVRNVVLRNYAAAIRTQKESTG